MKKNKTKGSQEAYVQAVFFTEKGTRWFRFERAEPPKPPTIITIERVAEPPKPPTIVTIEHVAEPPKPPTIVHVKILTEKDKKA